MFSRICYIIGFLSLAVAATVAIATVTAQDQNSKVPATLKLEPFASETLQLNFTAKKRALVVCVGKRKSFLGLYVYDPHGNCVAWDDLVTSIDRPGYPDAVAVEWYPQEDGQYRVEIVNLSGIANEGIEITVR